MVFQDLGEPCIFREKPIAGMNRVGAGDFTGSQQCRNVEITVDGGRRADAYAFVGEANMHGVGIRGRVSGHGRDTEFFARALYAQGNFTAIGNQDLVEHVRNASRGKRRLPIL